MQIIVAVIILIMVDRYSIRYRIKKEKEREREKWEEDFIRYSKELKYNKNKTDDK